MSSRHTDGVHCTGCGQLVSACGGMCGRDLDPPRFCPECGRRLTVYVTPGFFTATCRDHGSLTAPGS